MLELYALEVKDIIFLNQCKIPDEILCITLCDYDFQRFWGHEEHFGGDTEYILAKSTQKETKTFVEDKTGSLD